MDTDWWSPWQAMAGLPDATAAAETYAAAAARGGPAAAEAARAFAEFLRSRFTASRWPGAAALATGLAAGSGAGADLAAGFGPAALFAHFPALGATREMQLRAQRIAAASRRIEDAQRRLQQLWSEALQAAAAEFAARLTQPAAGASAGAPAAAWRELYDLWIECAEDAYASAAHGDAFCRALADGVNAGAALRTELQAAQEQAAKILDLPTRSEFDSLLRRLLALERASQVAPAAAGPATRKAGRRRAGRKTPKGRR